MDSDRKQADLADKGAEAYRELVRRGEKEAEEAEDARQEQERIAAATIEFERVAQSMRFILDEKNRTSSLNELPAGLSHEQRQALEWLHAAMYGENSEVAGHISGAERKQELNKALAVLQPSLASGLSSHTKTIDKLYDKVTNKVVALRKEIKSQILAESTKFKRGEEEEEEEEEEEDEDGDEDGDGDDEGEEEADGDETTPKKKKKKKKKKRLLRRLFRSDEDDPEEPDSADGDDG
jgi:hypothetical protein